MLTDAVAVVKNIDALAAATLKAGRALRPSYLLGMCVYIALLLALLLDLRTHLYLRVCRPEGRPSVLAFFFLAQRCTTIRGRDTLTQRLLALLA